MEARGQDIPAQSEELGLPSLGLVYEEAKYVLNIQLDQIDKLDTKAGLILGAGGVILTILLGEGSPVATSGTLINGVLLAGGLLITLSLFFAIWALRVRHYTITPNPYVMRTEYVGRPLEAVKLQVLDNLVGAYQKNDGLIESKAKSVRRAWRFLAFGVIAIGLFFV